MRLSPSVSSARAFATLGGLVALLLSSAPPAQAQTGSYAWIKRDTSGNVTAYSPVFSGGQWYSGYGDPTVPVPYGWGDYGSGGATETGSSSGQVNSTGTVTVIFTWQPAYAGEPAPPALITQTCDASWYCNAPAPPAASCSNGLSDPEIDASSGQGESRGTHYSVVSPDANGRVTVILTGAQAHVPLSSSGYYGSHVRYDVDAYPIVLSSPDPLGRPDLGDGKNQFVYSADTPDGYLYVPGALQAVGAGSAEANWLIGNSPIVGPLDKVNLTIDGSVIPNTFTHQWAVSGSTIYVNTPQDVNNPYPGYQFNHWIFKGLPTSNSGFGNHTVNLLVQGAKSQTAKIQTFFDMYASNWPGSNGYTPNWFWYYQHAYTPPLPDAEPANYNPNLGARGVTTIRFQPGSTDPTTFTYDVEIGPNAPDDDIVNVFDIDPTTSFVTRIGGLSIKGLYCYARVISHEEEHVHLVKQQIVVPYSPQTGPPNGIVDSDGDGIPDVWEKAHHMDPNRSDTTGEYSNATGDNAGKGDVECLSDIAALGELSSHQGLWQQDWGAINHGNSVYSGLQYGKRPLYFPWQYIDDASSYITTSLPNEALTALP